MGTSRWCRNCSRNTNHSGMGGNWWKVEETQNTVLVCHSCGHLRTVDEVELSEGTEIVNTLNDETNELARDGYLSEDDS